MTRQMDDIRTVQKGTANVAYSVLSQRANPLGTICLLASTGRGPEDFLHLAEHLAKGGLRVILPWPRGTGQSTDAHNGVTFHDLATDVAAILDHEICDGPVVVAGHAFGCWIARTLASDRPELVDGLIFLAAAADSWPTELSKAINTAMSVDAPEQERLAALRLSFFAEKSDPSPWLDGWYPELAELQRNASGLTDRARWWSSGHAPILDIVGTEDPFRLPKQLDFYQRELGDRVDLRTVAGASHALPGEKPAEAAQIILDWIGTLPSV